MNIFFHLLHNVWNGKFEIETKLYKISKNDNPHKIHHFQEITTSKKAQFPNLIQIFRISIAYQNIKTSSKLNDFNNNLKILNL